LVGNSEGRQAMGLKRLESRKDEENGSGERAVSEGERRALVLANRELGFSR
jgi:hypothetical protein